MNIRKVLIRTKGLSNIRVLLTGVAGFIGMHIAERILSSGADILGVDNLNAYYSPVLKRDRLGQLVENYPRSFAFVKVELADGISVSKVVEEYRPDIIIHLAAQAGVRYSFENPQSYIDSNITGFLNLLEAVKGGSVRHLIYASSSSVYGANANLPFREDDVTRNPLNVYAMSKLANELLAESYLSLLHMQITGLRLFTVYGPWGRPDMALHSFTDKILRGEEITLNNNGHMSRDFTYIKDVIDSIELLLSQSEIERDTNLAFPQPFSHQIYNVASGVPVSLKDFLAEIERQLGKKAKVRYVDTYQGEMLSTFASTDKLHSITGYRCRTPLEQGVSNFLKWHMTYYK